MQSRVTKLCLVHYQATLNLPSLHCFARCNTNELCQYIRTSQRLRGDQIEVFKIWNGYEEILIGHDVTFVKDQCRLDIRKCLFSQRTINEWYKLSTDCITASSENMFRTRLTHLRRAGYT